MSITHSILDFFGITNEAGPGYGFWSGFAGDLPEFAIFALVWKRLNCHARGCYRVGLHKVDGTHFTTCKKHHPDHPGSRAVSAEEIAKIHEGNRDH